MWQTPQSYLVAAFPPFRLCDQALPNSPLTGRRYWAWPASGPLVMSCCWEWHWTQSPPAKPALCLWHPLQSAVPTAEV